MRIPVWAIAILALPLLAGLGFRASQFVTERNLTLQTPVQLASTKTANGSAEINWIPDSKANVDGTSYHGDDVEATFAELVAVLGPPNQAGDGYKVSSEWTLVRVDRKAVAVLYDYKMTSLYDPEYPSVEEFRKLRSSWHVGAHKPEVSREFAQWLSRRVLAVRR